MSSRSVEDLASALRILKSHRFVDLTHAFAPGIPHFSGFPDETRTKIYGHTKATKGVGFNGSSGIGFFAETFEIIGQWGTHCDPPVHFHQEGRSIDQIPCSEMLLPLVVLDVREKVASNPDYVVTEADLQSHEAKYGRVPKDSFVALRTGWSSRWPDPKKVENRDAQKVGHHPGWSMAVLKILLESRGVTAIGHETTDTDPGTSVFKGNFECESYVLKQNKYQIELLNLADPAVPCVGAIVVVAFPKPLGGSGFPARVFAIVPNADE